MGQLDDRVAIVTGASSGIGAATARLLAREGARVVLGARRADALADVAGAIEAIGGEAMAVPGDVRDDGYAAELVATAEERFGGLDIAFNNAGTLGEMGATAEVSRAGWEDTLATNLTGAFQCARHQIPALQARGGGSLIFTSSFVGHTVGFPGTAAYAASKAGLLGLVRTLAAELGEAGIRVNALLPGGTDTPMARTMNGSPDAWSFVEGLHALRRVADPEEQARSVLYLAGPASSFVTGSALLVDGGVSITRT